MSGRFWLPVVGTVFLCACSTHETVPNGTQVLAEDITLTREAEQPDTATRELQVTDDAVLVAVVDENLTNVKLRLEVIDGEKTAPKPVEVENSKVGSSIELASLAVPEGSRIRVTLTSPQDAVQPGQVHLSVRQYARSAARDPRFASRLAAFSAWTAATNSSIRGDDAHKTAVTAMQAAIDGLDAPQGDARLAAHARLIKAKMLYGFQIDYREARAEAERAAAAFVRLPTADVLDEARAKYVEAIALGEMYSDRDAKDPTPEEAMKLASETLQTLSTDSPLGPIERARAIGSLGQLDVLMMVADSANKHFGQARDMYEAAGYTAGVREMRWNLAMVLVEIGEFAAAATEIDRLMPDIDKIADPAFRVNAYLVAGRAQTFSDRTDEGAQLILKALPLAQEYQLRQLQSIALQGLSNHYANRGDLLQQAAFSEEALKLARGQNNVSMYVEALASAGGVARDSGNLDRAFELLKEAVRLAPIPALQVRTSFDYGVAFYRKQDLPNAIAWYRKGLAVDLHDPSSHIYTDGKLGLAQFLVEYEPSTPADLAEADRLITEGLNTSLKVRDQWRIIFATRIRAALDARLGNNAAALANLEKVFSMSREYRERSKSTEARSGMLRAEEHGFRGYLDIIFADVAKRGPGVFKQATPAEMAALKRLERARYESFGGLRVGALDAKTSARVDQLFGEMGQKSLRISALVKGDLDTAQEAELRGLQLDMARLHAELDGVRTSAAMNQSGKESASNIAKQSFRSLAPGAAQLSYALGARNIYALARSGSGTVVTVLAPSRKDFEAQLAEFAKLEVQTSSKEIEAALEKFSAVLLPAGLLPEKSTALEIVAEGRLAGVPFPALRSPTNPQLRLAETHVVSMVMSLFDTDDALRARHVRPYRFVALASGSGTYRAATYDPAPRLQAATKEIRVAADLFKARDATAKIKLLAGADGTGATVRDIWSSGADVVHFATHALADLRQPSASLLVLPATDANGKATYLTAGQVQGWRGDVELVFLSACESAIGPPQYAAGMPGLQRAFLRAGARGVIATLAPIEDLLAQEFSADFYKRYTSGQPAAQALSDTQRAWLAPAPERSAEEQLRRRITALSHAYFGG